jgi:hypothetical protein
MGGIQHQPKESGQAQGRGVDHTLPLDSKHHALRQPPRGRRFSETRQVITTAPKHRQPRQHTQSCESEPVRPPVRDADPAAQQRRRGGTDVVNEVEDCESRLTSRILSLIE